MKRQSDIILSASEAIHLWRGKDAFPTQQYADGTWQFKNNSQHGMRTVGCNGLPYQLWNPNWRTVA
jgi:hypothetical protein